MNAEAATPVAGAGGGGREWSADLLRGVVEARGQFWVTARGGSMWPTIRDGDEVLLVPLGRPRVGDVVVLDLGSRLVLHRVVRARDALLVTRGDASRCEDGHVSMDDVVGRAVAARRGGSTVVALVPTLRFGLMPTLRGLRWHLRLTVARLWRRALPDDS